MPRQMSETSIPVLPNFTYCIAFSLLTEITGQNETLRPRAPKRMVGCTTVLDEFLVVRTDISERSVLHAKTVWNGAELGEAKPLVEMPRMDVALYDGVELENSEPVSLRLCKAVKDEFLADVPPTAFRTDGITRVADVSAASDIVRVEDVEAYDLPAFVQCDARVGLRCEEFLPGVVRQRLFLRECVARLHDLVPDGDHAVDVILFVFSDYHVLSLAFESFRFFAVKSPAELLEPLGDGAIHRLRLVLRDVSVERKPLELDLRLRIHRREFACVHDFDFFIVVCVIG